jgi:hypothetical protein
MPTSPRGSARLAGYAGRTRRTNCGVAGHTFGNEGNVWYEASDADRVGSAIGSACASARSASTAMACLAPVENTSTGLDTLAVSRAPVRFTLTEASTMLAVLSSGSARRATAVVRAGRKATPRVTPRMSWSPIPRERAAGDRRAGQRSSGAHIATRLLGHLRGSAAPAQRRWPASAARIAAGRHADGILTFTAVRQRVLLPACA